MLMPNFLQNISFDSSTVISLAHDRREDSTDGIYIDMQQVELRFIV